MAILLGSTLAQGSPGERLAEAEAARKQATELCASARAEADDVSTSTPRACHGAVRDLDRAVKALKRADEDHPQLPSLGKAVSDLQKAAKALDGRVKEVLRERAQAERERKKAEKEAAAAEKKLQALLRTIAGDEKRASRFCKTIDANTFDTCGDVLRSLERRLAEVPAERQGDAEVKRLRASYEQKTAALEKAVRDAERAQEHAEAQAALRDEYSALHKELYEVLVDLSRGKRKSDKNLRVDWVKRLDAAQPRLAKLVAECGRYLTIEGTTFSTYEPEVACELAKNRERYRAHLIQVTAEKYMKDEVRSWERAIEVLASEGRLSVGAYDELQDFNSLEKSVIDPLRDFYAAAGSAAPQALVASFGPLQGKYEAALRSVVAKQKWNAATYPVKTDAVAAGARSLAASSGMTLLDYGQKKDVWTIERHQETGIPLRKKTWAELQVQKPGESHCRLYGMQLTSEYDGEKYGAPRAALSASFSPSTCVR